MKAPSAMTLTSLREQVVRECWERARGSHEAIRLSAKVVEHFGARTPVAKIDAHAIRKYTSRLLESGASPAAVNRNLAALGRMLTWAVEEGHLAVKPRIARQRERGGRIRYLTADEEARLLAALPEGVVRDCIIFLLDTGARCGEALRLEHRDVVDGRATFWTTKSGKPRTIPLTARCREILASEDCQARRRPFAIPYHRVRFAWERARVTLGFAHDRDFVLHALRHSCASRLVQRGAPIRHVQEWLGHGSLAVTTKYAHLAPDSLDSMVGLLEPGQ